MSEGITELKIKLSIVSGEAGKRAEAATRRYSLTHQGPMAAEEAARELSKIDGVNWVEIEIVNTRHYATYRKGERSKG